eukprot:TRINITY_DN8246_c0_g2_i1.p1 TRINITY_DN8246_c0_g2~~TRINITY_DN8246_c0_g2_i1.p1  ORF type:complete len:129 (+),score=12.78 TRINITY_DN8246_c0_g2_i1:495-881(+)
MKFSIFCYLSYKSYEYSAYCAMCSALRKISTFPFIPIASIVLSCKCLWTNIGTKISDVVEVAGIPVLTLDCMIYSKCNNGHDLDSNDYSLVNDYDYILTLSSQLGEYWKKNPGLIVPGLGKQTQECSQ